MTENRSVIDERTVNAFIISYIITEVVEVHSIIILNFDTN